MDEKPIPRLIGKEGHKELRIDKRLDPVNINSAVHLRRSSRLPIKCDDCPYRAKEKMGNGFCNEYEEGSICKIRPDIKKLIDEYHTRVGDAILPMLHEEFDSNYEFLKFCETIEMKSGVLNPEISRRINALTNLGKVISEMETKRTTIEISEKKTLSPEKRDEIARMIKITREEKEFEKSEG